MARFSSQLGIPFSVISSDPFIDLLRKAGYQNVPNSQDKFRDMTMDYEASAKIWIRSQLKEHIQLQVIFVTKFARPFLMKR